MNFFQRFLPGNAVAFLLAAALYFSLDGLSQTAQSPLPELRPPQSGYQFLVRETLNYAVDWRVFPAGTASIHLEQQGNTEKIDATGESIGAVSLLFRVSDKFQSSFDRRTGCSAGFSRQLIEGRRQVNSDLQFDNGQHKATYQEKNLVSGISKHEEWNIPGCVTELLSAIFYGASQPIAVGQSFEMPLADAQHVVAVTMKAEGRETIKTPAGTYQTIRVQPTADAGVVKNRGEMWVWYTDDARHLPVQMRARLFWGTLTMRLSGIEQK